MHGWANSRTPVLGGASVGDPGFVRNEVHRPRPMRFDPPTGTWKEDPEGEGYYEVKT